MASWDKLEQGKTELMVRESVYILILSMDSAVEKILGLALARVRHQAAFASRQVMRLIVI